MGKIRYLQGMMAAAVFFAGCTSAPQKGDESKLTFANIKEVKIRDAFWTPKLKQWSSVTARDVLDKFEGRQYADSAQQRENNTFANFDDVAIGKRGTGHHAGLPWFDGLAYETIRGLADLLVQHPNSDLEARLDGYIDRIYDAQQADPDGYIDTWTELMEPTHRWGDNGGFLRFQHDVYNAGMLIEAGVHYYRATGKTRLLEVATRLANYLCQVMGPAPKRNIVPAHSGPEEAVMKLYWLYKEHPEAKEKLSVPAYPEEYYRLARFWIESRGVHCGFPLWGAWGNDASEKWIRDVKYKDAKFGADARPTWGDYAQDSIPVFRQQTIEGHAVRATLLATGIAAVAIESRDTPYVQTARRLWENMAGRRMFVTGGVGAVHNDEKFGPDYYLPVDAYLETCAAVGAGFFSQRMNELTADAKYMDELERVLYNNVLTGVSLSGTKYTYQNPLNSSTLQRWDWHPCPCCPPMFLKMMGALPGFIYAYDSRNIFVNLFIGSETHVPLGGMTVGIRQETRYPWEGTVSVQVDPEKEAEFAVQIRIPGWAHGVENPYGLYTSDLKGCPKLSVNGETVHIMPVHGYAVIQRRWKPGDRVELTLPMQPRLIRAHPAVDQLAGRVAIASGPLIYCLEGCDNNKMDQITVDAGAPLECFYDNTLLDGLNVIRSKGTAMLTAIPYYALGNRAAGKGYAVWIPVGP